MTTEDSWINLSQLTYDRWFFDFSAPHQYFEMRNINFPGLVFQSDLYFDEHGMTHMRSIYGLFDLLGDIGGVFELVTRVTSIFVFSISYHSFTLASIKKLFLVKTTSDTIFSHK